MKNSLRALLVALVVLLTYNLQSEARPTEGATPLAEQLQGRLGDTISEIEWLLDQLVNILTEMTDSIEQEPSLLQNNRFRPILVQVIRRIDYILEHFENSGPEVLTGEVQRELTRIDCVRIRLANYVSQTKRFDDRSCRKMAGQNQPALSAQGNNGGNNNGNNSHEQIMPLLTQIVSLLVQILNRLNTISSANGNRPMMGGNGGGNNGPTMPPPTRRPVWVASTINWDEVMGQFTTTARPSMGGAPNWDAVFGSTRAPYRPGISNGVGTTTNWNDLINQVMGSMGSTLVDPILITGTVATTPASTATTTTNWEDAMNNLINQWNQSMQPSSSRSSRRTKRTIVHHRIQHRQEWPWHEDEIHSLIDNARKQMPELVH